LSNTNFNGKWYETVVGKEILSKKYFHEGENFEDFVERVSSIFSSELKPKMAEAIRNADIFPAGRTLYGAGAKGKFKSTLSNCYILPSPSDDLRSINKVQMESEIIYSRGGGCGVCLSKLRPRGAKVGNAARTSTGAVSFINKFNVSADTIGAHGRRAALLVGLDCSHPDVEEFLEIKQNNDKIQSANLSILFTDEFMQAVVENKEYELKFDVEATGEKIRRKINARDFFYKFAKAQHDYAEPGALFIDSIRNYNILCGYPKEEYHIEISNP
jgi:ribonucleoside-diphosphate reductase alpha chain